MDLKILVISLVQGIGELLPISSSVNMALADSLFSMDFFDFSFKIALHAGSLVALMFYFRKEIGQIFIALFTKKLKLSDTYFFQLVAGTIPVVIFGFTAKKYVEEFQNFAVMGVLCIIFGIFLFVVDKISPNNMKSRDRYQHVSVVKSFVIGIFQTVAVFPGVSRLGITLTASRLLAIDRKKAIFFSMFLAIPSILGSLSLEIFDCMSLGKYDMFSKNAIIGASFTAIISMIFIVPCIKFMEKSGFFAIVVYRCLIGIVIWKLDFFLGLFR